LMSDRATEDLIAAAARGDSFAQFDVGVSPRHGIRSAVMKIETSGVDDGWMKAIGLGWVFRSKNIGMGLLCGKCREAGKGYDAV
jgi:hypothetical protein